MKQFALQINPEDVPEVKKLMEGLGYDLTSPVRIFQDLGYLILLAGENGYYGILNCTNRAMESYDIITLSDLREMTKEAVK